MIIFCPKKRGGTTLVRNSKRGVKFYEIIEIADEKNKKK